MQREPMEGDGETNTNLIFEVQELNFIIIIIIMMMLCCCEVIRGTKTSLKSISRKPIVGALLTKNLHFPNITFPQK